MIAARQLFEYLHNIRYAVGTVFSIVLVSLSAA